MLVIDMAAAVRTVGMPCGMHPAACMIVTNIGQMQGME
jgi:hypothetical protein